MFGVTYKEQTEKQRGDGVHVLVVYIYLIKYGA
jgi:hypothetical protein